MIGPRSGTDTSGTCQVTKIQGTAGTEECVVEYSTFHTVLSNVPYALVLLLGASIIVVGLGGHAWTWFAAVGFALYGMAGTFWIIVALCPHCPSYGQRSCPCGYGVVAARLRPKGDAANFSRKFRQTIPAIVPLWFIPVVIAAVSLIESFALPLAILVGMFALDAFILLPWLSRGHGCNACPQRERCPWWTRKAEGRAPTG